MDPSLIIGAEIRPVNRAVSAWASIACSAPKTGIPASWLHMPSTLRYCQVYRVLALCMGLSTLLSTSFLGGFFNAPAQLRFE
jgi:hypothetical protein